MTEFSTQTNFYELFYETEGVVERACSFSQLLVNEQQSRSGKYVQ